MTVKSEVEIEEELREFLKDPYDKQLVQIWSTLSIVVNDLQIHFHREEHGCDGVLEGNCVKEYELRKEGENRRNVFHKLLNEVSEKVLSVGKSN